MFFLILSLFSLRAQAAGTSSIAITVTITEVEMIEATVEFRPTVIRRTHRNIQCYIELPNPYIVEDIDVNTVVMTEVNGTIIEPPLKTTGRPMIGDFDKDGIPDLRVSFDIQPIISLLKPVMVNVGRLKSLTNSVSNDDAAADEITECDQLK